MTGPGCSMSDLAHPQTAQHQGTAPHRRHPQREMLTQQEEANEVRAAMMPPARRKRGLHQTLRIA